MPNNGHQRAMVAIARLTKLAQDAGDRDMVQALVAITADAQRAAFQRAEQTVGAMRIERVLDEGQW